jgi:hypothetical protein
MSSSYGVPIFRVTFRSQEARARAQSTGQDKSFVAAILSICQHHGSAERPYDASRAVEFNWLAVKNEVFWP